MISGPIPGQSLTKTPKNYAWERPPQINDPDEAVLYHLEKLVKPTVLDDVLVTLEAGVPIKTLTETMLTLGVAKGIHSIDISLIIGPVIHEFIATTAEEAGINFKHTFENVEENEAKRKAKLDRLFKASMGKAEDPEDEGAEFVEELAGVATGEEMPVEEAPMEEEMMVEEQAQPQQGLMSRV